MSNDMLNDFKGRLQQALGIEIRGWLTDEELIQRVTELSAQRDEFKRIGQGFERDYRNTFEQSCINLQRAEKAELLVAEGSRRLAQVTTALKEYVEWHGGCHGAECPQDDTCDCIGKSINDAVNAALSAPETEDEGKTLA